MTKEEKLALDREIKFQKQQRRIFADRFDANETLFLERQVVQLRSKMFEVEFLPSIARTLMPMATDIAPFANIFAYAVYERIGAAKIGSYKANDVPRIDLNVKEVQGKVVPIVAGFGWDIGEMQEAARLGVDLEGGKMKAARDSIETGIDQVLAFGTIPDETGTLPALAGMQGLLNNTDIAANGIISEPFYFSGTPPTPDVILAKLSALPAQVANQSKNKYTANTLLMPTNQMTYITQTPFSTLSGESILTVFKRNNPTITTVAPWWRLDTAGVSGVPRAVAYQRDSLVLEGILPLDFSVMPPEVQGFEMVYNCHARSGGVKIYRPLGAAYGDYLIS